MHYLFCGRDPELNQLYGKLGYVLQSNIKIQSHYDRKYTYVPTVCLYIEEHFSDALIAKKNNYGLEQMSNSI
jgi:hypothetical protein